MKKYTTPEIEMVKYDVDECLGASQETTPIANELQTEQYFVNNEMLNRLS